MVKPAEQWKQAARLILNQPGHWHCRLRLSYTRVAVHHQPRDNIMKKLKLAATLSSALLGLALASHAFAQEPVVGVANPESLFTDKDPLKNTNKQAALHIMKELLQCNHWADAGTWLTDKYLQHNPNVKSGLAPVISFFTSTRKPTPTCDKLTTPVVAVLAEGDLVTVVIAREYDHPVNKGQKYTSTWFDMWRFVGGKADEHWDGATIAAPAAPAAAAAPATAPAAKK
jgi:predicted SnoaL-like aldol condensation-catalyzing enzyme